MLIYLANIQQTGPWVSEEPSASDPHHSPAGDWGGAGSEGTGAGGQERLQADPEASA
ncbi:hypothetical protein MHYP_G00144110 [Metynnis hypsauchen]